MRAADDAAFAAVQDQGDVRKRSAAVNMMGRRRTSFSHALGDSCECIWELDVLSSSVTLRRGAEIILIELSTVEFWLLIFVYL